MQILFIDESGTPPPPDKISNAPIFVLGGIVIPEDVWPKLSKDLAQIKAQGGIDGEIKWRYFAPSRTGAKPHPLSHMSAEQKEAIRTKLYELIGKYKSIRLICAVVNVRLAYELPYVNDADDLYWYSYKQITERFQYYLQDLEKVVGSRIYGIIVCDNRAPKDDERLRELHHKLLTTQRTVTSNYSNLIEGLFIAPSHLSVGIQLADMVAGAVFRAKKVNDPRFFGQIRGSFRTSPVGRIEGYGVIKFPKGDW
ncbi:DUF3800 domain-containing protein [Alcaligenes faecalis]|uniref:DUF3800 domain-containing protein n=1 Tax=Alcaligenes faecalis TaxID=511 RepID=A0A2U2BHF0_ALCFA|nr:DUF3800 domain-containing protein [Alcaligenes faecalis]PWE13448.1 DUF3800 domain-containing protein [Alcaligenes faecalis]